VGDSRAYLQGRNLDQLTADHSLVAEKSADRILTPQEADASEMQSVLTEPWERTKMFEVDAANKC